jgi:hypothetical protein
MRIERLTELDCRFHTNGQGGTRRRWELIAPFRFVVHAPDYHREPRAWEIPPRFYTDFASIPRVVWPIVGPDELGFGPVPHDAGYYFGWEIKSYWDEVFLACMEADRIDPWKRVAAYEAVVRFGHKAWNDYRLQGTAAEQMERIVARVSEETAVA